MTYSFPKNAENEPDEHKLIFLNFVQVIILRNDLFHIKFTRLQTMQFKSENDIIHIAMIIFFEVLSSLRFTY